MKNQKSVRFEKESGEVTNNLSVAELTTVDAIRSRIFTTRGAQVMLDRDLAGLYGVSTGALNQAVKRNKNRFPERFMFQLNKKETENLKSQSVIASWGGSRSFPYAFTEQGIAMLSSVLRSETAILVSIRIMDAFVAMRRALASLAPLLSRIEATERRQLKQEDAQVRNEERFRLILDAMRETAFSSSTRRPSYMSGHRSTILARNALRSHRLTSPTYQISWRSFKVIVSREAQESKI